ncbi:MAG: hypothetical protein WBC06_05005 [Chitinophagaceae bacterium]
MSNRSNDILIQLIKSLEKAEKRHFKLYIKRSSGNEDLKIVRLFDVIDKLKDYDEKVLQKKMPGVTKPQLANLKTHLYKQILASLRLLKSADSMDLQLNEQFDYAHILYKKGLFSSSLRILERVKEIARHNQKFSFLIQVIALEKRIEGLNITRSAQGRVEQLATEANEVSRHIEGVTRLSNLALQLYSWFTKNGHVRNIEDEAGIKQFMKENLPVNAVQGSDFYERMYLYESYTWYAFIRQDFFLYYRYVQKWVDLFDNEPMMIRVETGHYIKGLHNLLNAHFDLRNHKGFDATLAKFKTFATTNRVKEHDNFRVQAFIYINLAKINGHFMKGTFGEGLKDVPQLLKEVEQNHLFIDKHRLMVLDYKIASLYFGSGDFDTAIDYLQKIIQEPVDLRTDLHSYARLMHLMAHYELGNDSIIESLAKSVYRFLARMNSLTVVEEEIFRFLRRSFKVSPRMLKPELEKLLENIKHLEKDRFQTRSFAYIDIISWVESKVYNKPMGEIIHQKYLQSRHRI